MNSSGPPTSPSDWKGRMELKTTCPRDCYDSCGMLVRVEEGRGTRVKGAPDPAVSRGALCAKCSAAYNSVWLDPEARVTQPLEPVGATGAGQLRERSRGRGPAMG